MVFVPYEPSTEEKETPEEDAGPSMIADFFAGQNVFITGGSGFLGRLLIEKLLRSCPKVNALYLFMRPKKGKSSEQRFKEITNDTLFEKLKEKQPDFSKKLVMIEGEIGAENLGLSLESKEKLKCIDVIFHGAATVRFDETLKVATAINIRGTKLMIQLAKEMPNLKAFVHVSTAFCYCPRKFIEEKFYDPPIPTDSMIDHFFNIDDEYLNYLTPKLLGKWPNTYAFTKAIGETTVQQYGKGLPVCVCRPSIVISTAEDPIPGWINNVYGATGVVTGAALGLLRTLHCVPENIADIIPADYVVANIIASAWDVAMKHGKIPRSISDVDKQADTNLDTKEIPVYNIVSSCQQPITWKDFMFLNEYYGPQYPSEHVLWHYMFRLNRYKLIHVLSMIFLHYLPAIIVDAIAILIGRKPMLMTAYRKIHRFSQVIAYFSTGEWKFNNDNVVKLWDKLGPGDRRRFNFYLGNLDWRRFMYYHVRGLRMYIVHDPLTTIEAGKRKMRKLKIAHYMIITLASIFGIYMVYVLAYYFLCLFCPWFN